MKTKNLTRIVLAFVCVMALTLGLFSIGEAPVAAASGDTYTLVTDATTLKAGDKVVIVAAGSDYALSTTQNTNNRGQAAVTKSGNTVTIGDDTQVLTLEAGTVEGTWAFNTGSGYLYAAGGTGKNNYLKTSNSLSASGSWNITISDEGDAIVKAEGGVARNWLRYNTSSKIFSCYASGQTAISIYRLESAGGGDTSCEHTNAADDGDCTTAVVCPDCSVEITVAKAHDYDNACDPDCNNDGCTAGNRTTEHKAETDDGDCTTDILCAECGTVMTEGNASHTFPEDDGCSVTPLKCELCGFERGAVYKQVMSAEELVAGGKYLIVCPSKGMAMSVQTGTYRKGTAVTIANGEIISVPDDAQIVILGASEGAWTFGVGEEYLYWEGSGNNVFTGETSHPWEITVNDDGTTTISVFGTPARKLQWNAGSPRFACYTSNQTAIALFKLVETSESHTPAADDGDCTTPVKCSACGEVTTAAKTHTWDNACDTKCNNEGCDHTRTTTHTPAADDGNCETPIKCTECGEVTTAPKTHTWDNACDTSCNNTGCAHTRNIEHTPEDDDDDCTTDILCSVCDAVTTKGNEAHTGGTATCTAKAECSVCGTKYGSTLAHTPEADDGNCSTPIKCTECDEVTTAAKTHTWANACDTSCNNEGCDHTREITHTPAEDDGNCETAVRCSVCDAELTAAKTHAWDNACDTKCNNEGCDHTRTTTHKPAADDGDCSTPIKCTECDAVTTEGKAHDFVSGSIYRTDDDGHEKQCANCSVYDTKKAHTPNVDAATEETRKYCLDCNYEIEAQLAHTHSFVLETVDGKYLVSAADCTSPAVYYKSCSCGTSGTETFNHGEALGHTPADDDGDCTTDILCSVCSAVVTEGNESHTGGTASCTEKACCSVCETPYGELDEDNHAYGDDGKCACGAEKPEEPDTPDTPDTPDDGEGDDDGNDKKLTLKDLLRKIIDYIIGIFKSIFTLLTF